MIDEDIRIVPGSVGSRSQSCEYWRGKTYLFTELTFVRLMPKMRMGKPNPLSHTFAFAFGPGLDKTRQIFGGQMSKADAKAVCKRHKGFSMSEEQYPEEDQPPRYYLTCENTETALAFTKTADFKKFCIIPGV